MSRTASGAILAVALLALPAPARAGDGDRLLREAARRHGVRIDWQASHTNFFRSYGTIASTRPSDEQIEKYAPILVRELDLYPPSVFGKGKVERIVLGRKLTSNGERRSGLAMVGDGILLLNVESYRPEGIRDGLHHEVFHLLEDRSAASREAWKRQNLAGFVYLGDGSLMQDYRAHQKNTTMGFVSSYSRASIAEDKAELFEYLMTDPEFVDGRCAKDALLRGKVELLKMELAPHGMDEAWWRALRAARKKK